MKIAIAGPDTATRDRLASEAIGIKDGLIGLDDLAAVEVACNDPELRVLALDWATFGPAGVERCRRIRRNNQAVPYLYVIALLEPAHDVEQLAALQAGADAIVIQPVHAAEFLATIEVARRFDQHEDVLRSRCARLEQIKRDLEVKNETLSEVASSDALTGLRNRRFFGESLDAQFSLARRKGLPMSLIMIDVDQFKAFNDEFGHLAGDRVLREVGTLLKSCVRDHDVVARYGGEEFAVLLPATEEVECLSLVERLRLAIADHPWSYRPITISLGVATLGQDESQPAELVDQADRALYHSKALGRNRAAHARSLAATPPNLIDDRLTNGPRSARTCSS